MFKKIIFKLNNRNRRDLSKKVLAYAAKGYTIIGKGNKALYINTPGTRKEISYIIAKDKDKYYILSTKRKAAGVNFDLGYANTIYLRSNKDPIDSIKYLANIAEKRGFLKYFKKEVSPDKFIKIILTKEGFSYKFFKEWFPELEIIEKESEEKLYKFNIVYDDSVKNIDKESIIDFITKASKYVENFGLSGLLYGKIFVIDKLRGSIIALYETSSDLIKLSRKASKKYNKDMVRNFVHELGHRLWEKKNVDKVAVRSLFNQVKFGYLDSDLEIGDVFEDKQGKKVEIKNKEKDNSGSTFYIVKKEEYKRPQTIFGAAFKYMTKIKGKPMTDISIWKPSEYSIKGGYIEFFCEIFAHGLVNNNKMYKDFIKKVVK